MTRTMELNYTHLFLRWQIHTNFSFVSKHRTIITFLNNDINLWAQIHFIWFDFIIHLLSLECITTVSQFYQFHTRNINLNIETRKIRITIKFPKKRERNLYQSIHQYEIKLHDIYSNLVCIRFNIDRITFSTFLLELNLVMCKTMSIVFGIRLFASICSGLTITTRIHTIFIRSIKFAVPNCTLCNSTTSYTCTSSMYNIFPCESYIWFIICKCWWNAMGNFCS